MWRIVICLFLLCSCFSKQQEIESLPFFNSSDFTPIFDSDKCSHRIAEFNFTDQNGKPISKKTFEDKVYVANFFFTVCPGICPTMTQNMIEIQNEFLEDSTVLLLSHSVTPWIDSVGQLRKFATEKGILDSKYFLATGDENEIYKMARSSYFIEKKQDVSDEEEEFVHSENLVLIDEKYRIRGIYNGTSDKDIKRLIRHLKILLKTY